MAWIESHEDLENHPKLIALGLAMGWNRYEASGRLHVFWKWCLKYAPTGDLHKYNDAQLADAVGLNPLDAQTFMKAMTAVESCWIDRGHGPNGESIFRVHDWPDYVKRYLKDAKFRDRPEKWKEVLTVYAVSISREKHGSHSRVTQELLTVPTYQPNQPTNQPAGDDDRNGKKGRDPDKWSEAQTYSRCWLSAERPDLLKNASTFAKLIYEVGKEKAVERINKALSLNHVEFPFTYALKMTDEPSNGVHPKPRRQRSSVGVREDK